MKILSKDDGVGLSVKYGTAWNQSRAWNQPIPEFKVYAEVDNSFEIEANAKENTIIVTATPVKEATATSYSLEYWVEGTEYTDFEKFYMKYFVWDENAFAFTIMAISCAGCLVLIILCGIGCGIHSCLAKNKVKHMDQIEKMNGENQLKYIE